MREDLSMGSYVSGRPPGIQGCKKDTAVELSNAPLAVWIRRPVVAAGNAQQFLLRLAGPLAVVELLGHGREVPVEFVERDLADVVQHWASGDDETVPWRGSSHAALRPVRARLWYHPAMLLEDEHTVFKGR